MPALLNEVVPETAFPPGSVTLSDTELAPRPRRTVTVGSVESGLLDEPVTGVELVTSGWLGGCVVSKIASTE